MKSVRFVKWVAALAVLAGSPAVNAAYVFAPSLYYKTQTIKVDSGTQTDDRYMTVDFRLGYVFDQNGLYVGGMYELLNDSYINGDMKGYSIGPSIGYVNEGFSAIATYHVVAERKITAGGVENKYSSGTGYQIDVAYAPQVSSNFGLGPVVTYQSIKYTKATFAGGSENAYNYEVSGITPGFMFFFKF